MPAQISILSVLLSSEGHRDVLLKILNESHVPKVLQQKISRYYGASHLHEYNNFTVDELTLDGTEHNNSLHVDVGCKGMVIAQVLIDNGFVFNVCHM